jgi:hypothetical protein
MSSSTPVVDSITIYPIKSYACVMQCNGRTLVTMCVMCHVSDVVVSRSHRGQWYRVDFSMVY